ncbi:MAG: PAS domain S-box protein [Candidatus Latescibacterota bacterium]
MRDESTCSESGSGAAGHSDPPPHGPAPRGDITDPEDAEFRRLAEALPQLVWMCRADGRVDYLNHQWLEYTGATRAELLADWLGVIHPDDRERAQQAWRAAEREAAPYDLEYRLRRHDGTYRWFKVRATALRDAQGRLRRWYGSNTDVDDLVRSRQEAARAGERLQGAHERIRSLARFPEENPSPVFRAAADGTLRYANAAARAMLERLGCRAGEPLPEELREAARLALAGGAPREVEVSCPCGRTWSVVLSASTEGEANLYGRDITERRQAEEALRRQNAVLQGIALILGQALQAPGEEALGQACLRVVEEVTGSDIGFIGEIGPDGLMHDLAISEAGWAACALVNTGGHRRAHLSFAPHGIYGRVLRDGRSLIANDPPSHPDCIGVPEGHARLTAFLGVPLLQEGRVVGMVAVANREGGYRRAEQQALEALAPAMVEALYRKRAEAALRESEERFRAMADGTPLVIWVTDAEGRMTFVNRAYCEFYGTTEEAVRSGSWQATVHPDDAPAYTGHLMACLHERRPFHARGRVGRHDGQWRWVESCGQPRFSSAGEFLGLAGSSPDITERMEGEEALRRLNSELEQRVSERTAELQERAEQLARLASQLTLTEQRERRRLARVLHDHLQQLLVGATFGLEVLSRRLEPQEQETLERVRGLLAESIEASRSLTVQLSPPILHEGGLPAGLEWLARWMAQKHGLDVELELDPGADPSREDIRAFLFEAARELLLNAVKHAGVTRARVSLRALPDHRVEVVVSDEGRGFDTESVEARRQTGGGFGLLSIRERLALLGGVLEIDSALGRGTTVRLAASGGAEARRAAEGAARGRSGGPALEAAAALRSADRPPGTRRILLVDDHVVMRQGLSLLLAVEPDMEVVGEASTGREAVHKAHQLNPDVVLMDFSMPDMDGAEATRLIHAGLPHIRIIGLSMYEEADRATAMLRAGAEAYLTKSGEPEALLGAIRRGP